MRMYCMTEPKNKNKVVWTEVLDDDYGSLNFDCQQLEYPWPVCNHTEEIKNFNIGYTQGYLCGTIPFEAELFTNNLDEVVLSVILPWMDNLCPASDHTVTNGRKTVGYKSGSVVGMVSEKQSYDNSVLTIGMVDHGQCEDLNLIVAYNELLEETFIVNFLSPLRNGTLFFLTDKNGNDYVQVLVTLKDEDNLLATTPLDFKYFL